MRTICRARFALLLATATALALPGAAIAAEPAPTAPPAPVVAWQTHLAHMQAMPGTFGAHVRAHRDPRLDGRPPRPQRRHGRHDGTMTR